MSKSSWVLALLVAVIEPSAAEARSCAYGCGVVCGGSEAAAYFEAAVMNAPDVTGNVVVQIERRLGGVDAITYAPGDQVEDVPVHEVDAAVQPGDRVFVTIALDGTRMYVRDLALIIREGRVVCEPTVSIETEQFVGIAQSDECEQITEDLGVAPVCPDDGDDGDGGCASSGSASASLLAIGALAVLCRRRRRLPE